MTDSEADARKYAFVLLGYRDRSEKELTALLEKKGFSEIHISGTVQCLKQAGYLNDHALALDLKRQAFHNKLMGHARAKKFLFDRGIPDEFIDDVLRYDEGEEEQKIQKLIEKKMKTMKTWPDKKTVKRLWDFLARRGYSYSTIRSAFHNIKRMEQEE